jgi:hypothetical protein
METKKQGNPMKKPLLILGIFDFLAVHTSVEAAQVTIYALGTWY